MASEPRVFLVERVLSKNSVSLMDIELYGLSIFFLNELLQFVPFKELVHFIYVVRYVCRVVCSISLLYF